MGGVRARGIFRAWSSSAHGKTPGDKWVSPGATDDCAALTMRLKEVFAAGRPPISRRLSIGERVCSPPAGRGPYDSDSNFGEV